MSYIIEYIKRKEIVRQTVKLKSSEDTLLVFRSWFPQEKYDHRTICPEMLRKVIFLQHKMFKFKDPSNRMTLFSQTTNRMPLADLRSPGMCAPFAV